MTKYFTTEKGKSRTNIFEASTGEFVCQLLNREVADWLRRAEKSRHEEETFWKPAHNEARLEAVKAYLQVRTARKIESSRQGNLF